MNKTVLFTLIALAGCRGNQEKTPLDKKIESLGRDSQRQPQRSRSVPTPPPKQQELASVMDESSLSAAAAKCEAGDGLSCALAAEALAQGIFVELDEQRAVNLYQQGCDKGAQQSCAGFARMLAKGQGIAAEVPRAEKLALGICESGEPRGCYELAAMYETVPDLFEKNTRNQRAIQFYQQACDSDLADGCHELAMLFHSGRGGAGKDPERAQKLIGRACDLGDRQSCLQRGMIGKTRTKSGEWK